MIDHDITIDGSHVAHIGALYQQIRLAAAAPWKIDGAACEFTHLSLDLVTGRERLGIRPRSFLERELSQ